jgi:hypothetical protein
MTTKHRSYYVATTFCPACARSQCALCARNKPSRHCPYGSLQPLPVPKRSWHYQYGLYHLRLTASPLFWWLLTACPCKVFSFQLRTLLLPQTLQVDSFPMHSQSATSLSMYPPTEDRSLLRFIRLPPSHAPALHIMPPPLSQRSGRTDKQHLGTAPSDLLPLRAGQLVHAPSVS